MIDKIKCYILTPKISVGDRDSYVFKAGGSWSETMQEAESLLDSQFGNEDWESIGLNIECVLMAQSQLDELET